MFPDVPENHWAYEAVKSLGEKGLIEGYPDGSFGGERSLSRYEFAEIVYRALERGVKVEGVWSVSLSRSWNGSEWIR